MSSAVPSAKCGASIVASAISFLSVGDQVVVVARPTWRPRLVHRHRHARGGRWRPAAGARARRRAFSTAAQSISRPTIWRFGPARCSAASAARPTNGRLSRPRGARAPSRTACSSAASISAFLLPKKSTSIEQQARLDPRDVEREHPGRVDVEGAAAGDERVPHVERAVPRHPDLVAEIAGVAGPRDVAPARRRSRRASCGSTSGRRCRRRRHGAQQAAGGRPLQRERRHLLGDVLDP